MPGSMSVPASVEFVSAARSVVDAGEGLGDALGEDRPTIRAMAERLEKRLIALDTGSDALRDQAFEELSLAAQPPPEPMLEDVLGSVILDVQASRLAVAAGRVVGEVGPPAGHDEYDAALSELRETTSSIEAAPTSLGFEATVDQQQISSPDDPSARASFQDEAGRTLQAIVEEAVLVVRQVLEQVRQFPLISELGDLVDQARAWKEQQVPSVGRLVRLGLSKLKKALEGLCRLFKLPGFDDLWRELAAYWADVRSEGPLHDVLRRAVGTAAAERRVQEALALDPLDRPRVDAATAALRTLADRYRNTMGLIGRLLRTFTLLAATMAVVALAVAAVGPYLTTIAAGVYLVVLAGVVVTARDYADSAHGLGLVRGVGSIAKALTTR